jgi:hypothetical protein
VRQGTLCDESTRGSAAWPRELRRKNLGAPCDAKALPTQNDCLPRVDSEYH